MRSSKRLAIAVVVFLVAVVVAMPAALAAPGASGPLPDLVVRSATAHESKGRVDVDATVANKGAALAKASTAGAFLSKDSKQGGRDVKLGGLAVAKLKAGKSRSVSGTFRVPDSVGAGSYFVIVCADVTHQVKEKDEAHQCLAAGGKVSVRKGGGTGDGGSGGGGGGSGGGGSGGGGSGGSSAADTISVAASAGSGGSVAASGVSGGSCAGTSCTLTKGAGSVTFTPTPSGVNTFASWGGSSCNGYTSGAGNSITFTNPTAAKSCTANFNEMVKISWTNEFSWATVSGCGETTSVATSGFCVVPKGSTGTISAQRASSTFHFVSFAGASCNGTETVTGVEPNTTHTMTFTNAVADHDCVVNYSP